MAARAQPHSLKQGTSAIGSEIFASFERDIEDAIFETIAEDQNKARVAIKRAFRAEKPSFGKLDNCAHQDNDAQKSGLNIFAKRNGRTNKVPIASQIALSLAVCAFTIAVILPIVWMIDTPEVSDQIATEIPKFAPDATIATGSVVPLAITPQILDNQNGQSAILDKPKSIEHDNSASLHVVGKGSGVETSPEGSVIYFGSQD